MRSHEIVITPCSIYMFFSHQREQTALMKASSGGHVECVRLLLEKGADVNHKDEVSAGSHQLLSAWHVPLCKTGPIVEVACGIECGYMYVPLLESYLCLNKQ